MIIHPVVKQTILFLLVFAAVNEGIKFYFNNVTAKKMLLVQRDDLFHAVKEPLDFLFLGHSRGLASIDTANHPELFNFCSGGESNIYTYYKLKYILEKSDVSSKIIVMPYGFGSFNARNLSTTTNSFYWIKYVDYLELGQHREQWSDYLSLSIKAHLFPYFQRPSLQLDKALGKYTGQNNNHAPFSNVPEKNRTELALQNLEANNGSRALYDSISLLYLEKTIALCKAKKQRIVFVKYPVTSYYHEAKLIFSEQNKLNTSKAETIIHSTWDQVPMLNYETSFFEQPDLFRDLNHLNKEGAAAFTPTLLNNLNTILQEWNAE